MLETVGVARRLHFAGGLSSWCSTGLRVQSYSLFGVIFGFEDRDIIFTQVLGWQDGADLLVVFRACKALREGLF